MRGLLWMLLTALMAAGAFYVLREHWGHALGLLPYLLFLACPLLHFFMHRSHGRGHDAHSIRDPKNDAQEP